MLLRVVYKKISLNLYQDHLLFEGSRSILIYTGNVICELFNIIASIYNTIFFIDLKLQFMFYLQIWFSTLVCFSLKCVTSPRCCYIVTHSIYYIELFRLSIVYMKVFSYNPYHLLPFYTNSNVLSDKSRNSIEDTCLLRFL